MALDRTIVTGLREAQAVFRKLEATTREVWIDYVIRPTAAAMVLRRQGRLQPGRGVRTGALKEAQGFTVNTRTGSAAVGTRLGFERFIPGRHGSARTSHGARAHRPTKIGHLVEFKHHPFAVPAAHAEAAPMLARSRTAGRQLEERMAAIGNVGSHTL